MRFQFNPLPQCNQVFSTTASIVSSVAQFLRACTPLTPSWPASYTARRAGEGSIKISFYLLTSEILVSVTLFKLQGQSAQVNLAQNSGTPDHNKYLPRCV